MVLINEKPIRRELFSDLEKTQQSIRGTNTEMNRTCQQVIFHANWKKHLRRYFSTFPFDELFNGKLTAFEYGVRIIIQHDRVIQPMLRKHFYSQN